MDEIQRHKSMTFISKELMCYAGCTLKGWNDDWNGHVTSYCNIVRFGNKASKGIRDFLHDGVYSFPCYNERHCKQWLFFRSRDFVDNLSMHDRLRYYGWWRVRTDDQRRRWYLKCPECAHPRRC